MKNVRVALLFGILAVAAITLRSQSSAEEKSSFEVASVKEHPFAPGFVGLDFQPEGRFVARMAPLQMLIWSAYDILPAQLQFAGEVPEALKTNYDIEAKTAPGAIPSGASRRDSERKMALMLQSLLADRFKLKMHIEKKEQPVYALLVEKNGLKLPKAPDRDCSVRPSPCGWRGQNGPASGINGVSVTLKDLAESLTFFSDRSIWNKTGIEEMFDIHLPPYLRGAPTPESTVDGVPVDLNTPSLATVLHEVGLRLEPQRALLDIYVIDHVEKPTSN